jgi:hypothetical protein
MTNNEHRGLRGGARGYSRNLDDRLVLRMVRQGWLVPEDKIPRLRQELEDIITDGRDERAKVQSYRALVETEIAIVNSTNQIASVQDSKDSGEPQPEPIEPD